MAAGNGADEVGANISDMAADVAAGGGCFPCRRDETALAGAKSGRTIARRGGNFALLHVNAAAWPWRCPKMPTGPLLADPIPARFLL